MSSAIEKAARLKPEIRLAQAVSHFEFGLSSEQKAQFRSQRAQALRTTPEPSDIMHFTAEIDRSQNVGVRCFGPRFTNFLHAIQQFAALGDVVVGGSQNIVICGVWALVRISLLAVVNCSSYLESISQLFMEIGRSAPRYSALATLYQRSKDLQSHINEYFIVVVQLCHRLMKFAQKSSLHKFATTLSDSNLKTAQVELHTWSTLIRDEVNLLVAKRVEEEAANNSRFRTFSEKFSKSMIQKEKFAQRHQILDLCTEYEYETAWKQTRKAGKTSLFRKCSEYQSWKTNNKSSCTLVYADKLGSGKSVTLANIIDDLNISRYEDTTGHKQREKKNVSVAYFFCRHDAVESLKARTIIGTLVRQTLQCLPRLPEDMNASKTQLDLDEMIRLVERALPPEHKAYLVVDGLDLCDYPERVEVISRLRVLQNHHLVSLCVTFRLEVDDALDRLVDNLMSVHVAPLPNNTQDIEQYIEMELERRITNRELELGNPGLILDIRSALLNGSRGMFLWVVLQIQSLCLMQTDREIRDALSDLPKDLPGIYSRIVGKSQELQTPYQRRIFEIIIAARRPLTTDEMREALSITAGDYEWAADKLLNNVFGALSSCGCLLTIDEEESTVRLVHPSVKQYLTTSYRAQDGACITHDKAQQVLTDLVVTYLSYGVFGTQLSTFKVPEVAVGDAPIRIVDSITTSAMSGQNLALKILKARRQANFDVGKTLSGLLNSASPQTRRFYFHDYAREFCIDHAIHVSPASDIVRNQLLHLLEQGTVSSPESIDNLRPIDLASKLSNNEMVVILAKAEKTNTRNQRKYEKKLDVNLDDLPPLRRYPPADLEFRPRGGVLYRLRHRNDPPWLLPLN
ncbi:hypothetical protein BKA66DRAFT_429213 [Pyrenochaeta sp. MPI-SDFR-AT-0127]|nr:hypothetical protein BKA66DRAFT_429213 [Pyrenochaeta sp. MPI-SDFR-AT-0127]